MNPLGSEWVSLHEYEEMMDGQQVEWGVETIDLPTRIYHSPPLKPQPIPTSAASV